MALTPVVALAQASINDLNQIINLIQGAGGATENFLLQSATGTDFKVRLSDSAGAQKLAIQNLAGSNVATIDSLGNVTINGSFSPGTLQIPTSASPAETTAGQAVWDTVRKVLTLGDGSNTQSIGLTTGAGSAATAANHIVWDTTNKVLQVWDGSASQTISTGLASLRADFRNNRRLLAIYATPSTTATDAGLGFVDSSAGTSVVNINGEAASRFPTPGGAQNMQIVHPDLTIKGPSPAKSPRMLFRIEWPVGAANMTTFIAGFFDAVGSATPNGAYLRINTTGHLFFVTRQGGSETTDDLGAQNTSAVTGWEIETVDAGVTWVCRNQAGVAQGTSHTTNVPTAASALFAGISVAIAGAASGTGGALAYMEIEATIS